jgi:hypothetical protein
VLRSEHISYILLLMIEAVPLEREVLVEVEIERIVEREKYVFVDEITNEPITEVIVIVEVPKIIQLKSKVGTVTVEEVVERPKKEGV